MIESAKALIKIFGQSDIGTVRKHNEDKFCLADLTNRRSIAGSYQGEIGSEGFLFLVCDGAGGDGRGEIASELAVHIFQEEIFQSRDNASIGIGDRLIRAANVANDVIWQQSQKVRANSGMACTLTAAWIVPPLAYVVEVGDSRAYLVRGNNIKQITRDQSMIQTLLDGGVITPNAARIHPYRNIVLQALGAKDTVVPVVTSLELARGDRLLLCSDGLSKWLTESLLLELMHSADDPTAISAKLIEIAIKVGTDDNTTAVTAIVEGDAFSPPEALSALVLMEAADESELSDELEDLTDLLSPVAGGKDE